MNKRLIIKISLFITLTIYIYRYMKFSFKTTLDIIRIKKLSKNITKKKNWSIIDMWYNVVDKNPYKIAIHFGDRHISYKELDNLSNKIANWALDIGLGKDNVCALMMLNRPEYVAFWLGLAKIGAVTGLININLSGPSLFHCLEIALTQAKEGPYIVVYGPEHENQITQEIKDKLSQKFGDVKYYIYSDPTKISNKLQYNRRETIITKSHDLNILVNTYSNRYKYRNNIIFSDSIFYIYTSGTTGLPKAAKIPHIRFYTAGHAFRILYGLKSNDILYISLPLYHSNGGMIGISCAWATGMTVVLREHFSATNFITDCIKYNCTVSVYIGEICRYILNTPSNDNDRKHKLRLMIGNGLRPDIWQKFIDRFGIKMGEFYGSTEGNANLFNNTYKVGAIGYLPKLLRLLYPVKIIKFNQETEELVRNNKGLCMLTNTNEPGEGIGLINEKDATRRFDGYTNETATNKKIATGVLKKDDKWFRTGDLLKMDKDGYVYFVDRIGDTFRWKGENVSTTEVAEIMSSTSGLQDINVYGVIVGNQDGRAGMAAIQTNENFDFKELYNNITKNLPSYAQPCFLRVLPKASLTGTFKHKKVDLRNEGFDITKISDKLYYKDNNIKTYIQLTPEIYNNIIREEIRI